MSGCACRASSPFGRLGPRALGLHGLLNMLEHVMVSGPARMPRVPVAKAAYRDGVATYAFEVPGAPKAGVSVSVEEGQLCVRCMDDGPVEDGEKSVLFLHSLPLPENADEQAIGAKLADGVLTVSVPVKPRAAPRCITVNGE